MSYNLEDTHRQVFINGKDFDIILRTNDEGTAYTSWDLFDYEAQKYVHTCYDIPLALFLIKTDSIQGEVF